MKVTTRFFVSLNVNHYLKHRILEYRQMSSSLHQMNLPAAERPIAFCKTHSSESLAFPSTYIFAPTVSPVLPVSFIVNIAITETYSLNINVNSILHANLHTNFLLSERMSDVFSRR